jgi:hypothetical protein
MSALVLAAVGHLPIPQNCATATAIHFWGMGTKAVAKSCGGHIQSIHHVIQAVANLSSYSLGSQSASILYGTLRHSFYLILRSSKV